MRRDKNKPARISQAPAPSSSPERTPIGLPRWIYVTDKGVSVRPTAQTLAAVDEIPPLVLGLALRLALLRAASPDRDLGDLFRVAAPGAALERVARPWLERFAAESAGGAR